jgi:hypothetical protein
LIDPKDDKFRDERSCRSQALFFTDRDAAGAGKV